jgi:hypothetical protein
MRLSRTSPKFVLAVGATAFLFLVGVSLVDLRQAEASSTASATANATATVIASIAISRTTHLVMGEGAPSDVAATISPVNGSWTGRTPGGTTSRGEFAVTGQASHSFAVTGLPSTDWTITTDDNSSADERIIVNAFHFSVDGGAQDTNGSLSGGGTATVYVGATIAALTAAQVAGAYSSAGTGGRGSFTVTVTYN